MNKGARRMEDKDYFNYVFSLPYPKTKQLYLMRTYVKRIELKNLDFFTKRKKIVFEKYNIIKGDKKSGKTFLTYLIYNAYMFNSTFFEEFPTEFTGFNDAQVKIVYHSITDWIYTLPKKNNSFNKCIRLQKKSRERSNIMCFLFDEPDLIYNNKERKGFLNYLKNNDAQMIITSDIKEDYKYPKEYKIIKI